MALTLFVLLPLILAALTDTLYKFTKRTGLVAAVVGSMVLLFGVALWHVPLITDADPLVYVIEWVPQLGLSFSLYMDGLALVFVTLVTGIGIGVTFYTAPYFEDDDDLRRFYFWLMIFTAAMLWLVLAGNLLVLFIAWELTSISSFMLIGFKGAKYESARSGALQALMVTGGGGLALIVGFMLLGTAVGSFELERVLETSVTNHPYYIGIVVLVALGAFTKSAQFPFHFWLPGAMSAPSPASAFLHSATMVKAGVYLMARLYPTLSGTAFWETLLVGVGLATLLIGSVLAVRQTDLKGILAYTTIAQLGTLMALIGVPNHDGTKAMLVGLLAHALYKAPLFLMVGVIEHSTGTRDITKLGGLWKDMRGAGIVVALASLSMAGVIPTMGFLGKETLLEVFIAQPLQLGVIVVSAILTVYVAVLIFWRVFMGKLPDDMHPHAAGLPILLSPAYMVTLGTLLGLAIPYTLKPLITPAVPKSFSLYLFHGFNTAFMLSLTALGVGAVLYLVRGVWQPLWAKIPLPNASRIYNGGVGLVEAFGDWLITSQNGKLRYYLIVILGSVAILLASSGTLIFSALQGINLNFALTTADDWLGVFLVLLVLASAAASIRYRSHTTAALALGAMGYAVGGLFLLEFAPDVALVQFLVETVGTVLVIVMIGRIGRDRRLKAMEVLWDSSRGGVWRDAIIATVIGVAVGIFALVAVGNRASRETIATWHLENAYPLAGVTDVVASIVTDFRATDTLIEITVFSMAALGVLTVMTLARQEAAANGQQRVRPMDDKNLPLSTPLARAAAQILLPIALLIALAQLLYAGDRPGDGFTAGVAAGLAITLWYIVFGYKEAKERLKWLHPTALVTGGLVLATVNAVLPMLFGRAFFGLTKLSGFDAPADLHLASTLVFEISIFLAVFGGVSIIIEAIAHPEDVEILATQEMQTISVQEEGKQ